MRPFVLFLAAAALACAAEPTPQERFLNWIDPIAQQQLQKRVREIAGIQTTAQAEKRKEYVRAKILELIGGLPDYSGPLNPQITGRIQDGPVVIEKVVFESLSRLFVTANLYRPAQSGRHPAVLLPLGHWDNGKPAVQQIAANLALKGFVVLAYDPLGQGERLQIFDPRLGASLAGGSVSQHWMAGAPAVLIGQSFARHRIWDATRALDYLVSRPEVDADRIGCTGCSGGGTITTFISALDPRIKVAAPACYMNSFRVLFPGSVGDSEQSIPGFLSAGLDQTDFVELFSPKPWLISSTVNDFFTIEGARQVYQEARRWYRVYGAEDKVHWAIGPGGHGTPQEVREAIYAWFIRWLKDGQGDPREQPFTPHADYELQATKTGQVSTSLNSRDVYEVIREDYRRNRKPGTAQELLAAVHRWSGPAPGGPATPRTLSRTATATLATERIAFETEPGLELEAVLLAPRDQKSKPGVLVVETGPAPSALALSLAQSGKVVLALNPRDLPLRPDRTLVGDWLAATRAWLVGLNLPGMRAHDIRRGIDLLSSRPDVDRVVATAQGVAGVWLLMAAATDQRIQAIWLDRTPASFERAFENPLHTNLHEAVMPGFALHWDLKDLEQAIQPRKVIWTDPTDWMSQVLPLGAPYLYRPFEAPDARYLEELFR